MKYNTLKILIKIKKYLQIFFISLYIIINLIINFFLFCVNKINIPYSDMEYTVPYTTNTILCLIHLTLFVFLLSKMIKYES
jgi:hypothetical protein